MVRTSFIAAALVLSSTAGCLLAEEDCGAGFELVEARCVPSSTPPPYDPASGDAGARGDGAIGDALAPVLPDDGGRWADFGIALIVDRTPRGAASGTPATPGADIDSLQVASSEGGRDRRIGQGGEIVGAFFLDPFSANVNGDAEVVLGLPDGEAASLGTDGGYAYVQLALERDLVAGDVMVVVEQDEGRAEQDAFELYLCREPDDTLAACRSLGLGGPGINRFELQ